MKTLASIIAALFFLSGTVSAQTVSLGNYVWWDMNDNGKKDGGEFGSSGVTVKLYQDNNEDGIADAAFTTLTTTTNSSGFFLFANLAPAKYFVRISAGSAHYKTTVYGGDPDNNIDGDNNGYTQDLLTFYIYTETIDVNLNSEPDGSGAANTNTNNSLDLGMWKGNGLGDIVWLDMNGNGVQENNESGISNVTVILKDAFGNVLETTTTDAKGNYAFHDPVRFGTNNYQVEFITPTGYTPVIANFGSNDDMDSDPVNGVINNITVPNGQWNHTFDAGFRLLNSILPVQLSSFQAYALNNKVELRWISEYEKDAAHFVIEKSTDAKNFQQIGLVMAANSSDFKNNYQFSDMISAEKELFYYRLKMVDVNGSFEYSEIKIIRIKNNQQSTIAIQAYPNPVVNQLRVTIPQIWSNKKVVYQVISANGLILQSIQRVNSSQTETLDMANFASGTYIVRVICENESSQQIIVK